MLTNISMPRTWSYESDLVTHQKAKKAFFPLTPAWESVLEVDFFLKAL